MTSAIKKATTVETDQTGGLCQVEFEVTSGRKETLQFPTAMIPHLMNILHQGRVLSEQMKRQGPQSDPEIAFAHKVMVPEAETSSDGWLTLKFLAVEGYPVMIAMSPDTARTCISQLSEELDSLE